MTPFAPPWWMRLPVGLERPPWPVATFTPALVGECRSVGAARRKYHDDRGNARRRRTEHKAGGQVPDAEFKGLVAEHALRIITGRPKLSQIRSLEYRGADFLGGDAKGTDWWHDPSLLVQPEREEGRLRWPFYVGVAFAVEEDDGLLAAVFGWAPKELVGSTPLKEFRKDLKPCHSIRWPDLRPFPVVDWPRLTDDEARRLFGLISLREFRESLGDGPTLS